MGTMQSAELQKSLKSSPLSFQQPRESYQAASGPCDSSGKNDKNSMVEVRYSSVLFTLGALAGGVRAVAADTTRIGFHNGVGEAGGDEGYGVMPLSYAETNLLSEGSLNNGKNGMFVGRAFGVIIEECFAFTAGTRAKRYDQNWRVYAQDLMRAIGETGFLTISDRDEAVNRFLGTMNFWPGPSSMTGDQLATVGTPWGPATLIPFREDYRFYTDSSGNATQISVICPDLIEIVNDPANPIPDGFSVQCKLVVYGGPVSEIEACRPDGDSDGKSGGSTLEDRMRLAMKMAKEFGVSLNEATDMVNKLSKS